MRAWYLRRAIPWVALLGCCLAAVTAAVLLARWPRAEEALLPVLLAGCAAAAGFAFDEPLPALAEVTPRGATWRRTTRLGAVALPTAVWVAATGWQPEWWLAGGASIGLLTGLAALAARRGTPAPGTALAGSVALAVFAPLVLSIMLGWTLVYPFGPVTTTIVAFWTAVAGLGAVGLGLAFRPGLR